MARHTCKIAAFAATLFFSMLASAADEALSKELNKAQQLVFITDHLEGIPAGSTLNYDFNSQTKGKKSYSDAVTITVTQVLDNNKRNLEFDFLSGSHHIDFSPAAGYTGNPVIIHFLERDISKMSKDSGNSAGYFRNQIRKSFRQPEQTKDIKFSFQGKQLDGVKVSIKPFNLTPDMASPEIYANKRYDFTFSEQIPGGIYRIHTHVSDENSADVVIDEKLTFNQITPAL